MNKKILSRYFISKCEALSTFKIDSWLDKDGYPKDYGYGSIRNTAQIPEGTVKQSLYISGGTVINIGLLDCDPGIGNDDVELDMSYVYTTGVLTLNYNNISLQESYDEEYEDECDSLTITVLLAEDEGCYFQESLIEEKLFTFEEEQMLYSFFMEMHKRFVENKVPLK